jgi:chromosome segregation ATPase
MSSNGSLVSTLLLVVIGTGGIGTAIMALLRLRPDANTAAVTQAQGAMDAMNSLIRELRLERDEWRDRALQAEESANEARCKVTELEGRIRELERDRR